jgi:hypothetical protein
MFNKRHIYHFSIMSLNIQLHINYASWGTLYTNYIELAFVMMSLSVY